MIEEDKFEDRTGENRKAEDVKIMIAAAMTLTTPTISH